MVFLTSLTAGKRVLGGFDIAQFSVAFLDMGEDLQAVHARKTGNGQINRSAGLP